MNNAGILGSIIGPPEWHCVEDFQHVMSVNTMGPVRTTLAFLPLIKKAKGRIIFMSSLAGRLFSTFTMPYSMSKFAVESFADGLRYVSSNIQVARFDRHSGIPFLRNIQVGLFERHSSSHF